MKLIETIDLSTFNYSGIFQKISALVSNPFSDFINNTNAKALDDIYYIEHSGDKEISYSYERYLQLEEDEIIPSAIDKIVDGLVVRFTSKWNKEYQALVSSTYNPLHNYDMEEETHRNIDVENTSYNNVFGYNTSSDNGVLDTQLLMNTLWAAVFVGGWNLISCIPETLIPDRVAAKYDLTELFKPQNPLEPKKEEIELEEKNKKKDEKDEKEYRFGV